jgi:hypothetical protein
MHCRSTSEADGPRQTGLAPNRLREEKKYRVHLRPRNPSCPQLSELLTSKTPSGKTAERCAKDGTWFSTNRTGVPASASATERH